MPDPCDVLIVGSGYGGAVAALRLRERGHEVFVLERGSEFAPGDFPADIAEAPNFMRMPSANGNATLGNVAGLFDLKIGAGVAAIVANALGGGSTINAGVAIRPDPDVFAQEAWPAPIRNRSDSLHQYMDVARSELRAKPTGDLHSRKGEALSRLGRAMVPEREAVGLDVTVDLTRCTRCGDCASGCNVPGAKITLRDSYLANARAAGALLFCNATVYSISRRHDGRWNVRIVPTEAIGRFRTLEEAANEAGVNRIARILVLSAGTFGTTEILQRSKAIAGESLWVSPALGTRFSGNGDSLSFSVDEPHTVNAIGIGADLWQTRARNADGPMNAGVGPTITRCLDLRQRPPGPDALVRPALEDRILIQEASVPGAIGRVFAELLAISFVAAQLDSFRPRPWRQNNVDPLFSGHWLRRDDVDDGLRRNDSALPQRTQVLLCMGHDGSKGRIVFLPERNEAVPFWEDPLSLRTYQYQEQILKAAARKVNGLWVPNPAWRLLPQSASTPMMSPKPPQSITTVHPLGGCPMGDHPRTSVVDHLGRVWRRAPIDVVNDAETCVYDNLLILDGSIIPTSLGCNPLLTITALAERAIAQNPALGVAPPVARRPARIAPASTCRQLVRWAAPVLEVEMGERLECRPSPRESAALRRHLGLNAPVVAADLQLRLGTNDWLSMWDDARHPLVVSGVLRVECEPQEGAEPVVYTYEVQEDSHADLLAAERFWLIRHLLCLPRVIITAAVLRSSDLKLKRPETKSKSSMWRTVRETFGYWPALMRAGERRRMRYDLRLRLDNPGANASSLRRQLRLVGRKRIEYAATCWELIAFVFSRIFGRPRRLRASFLEQACNLQVRIGNCPFRTPRMWFLMDFQKMVEKLPLWLPTTSTGDLASAMAAIASYPMVFARFAFKTRLLDFRLPTYSGTGLQENRADDLRTDHGVVRPEFIDLPVRIGASFTDGPEVDANRLLMLCLARYRRPGERGVPQVVPGCWEGEPVKRAKSVLLVHAFAMSGHSFTPQTLPVNMAETLYNAGYEVWILEHRISTRLEAHREQSTIEQIGALDIPHAVDKIIETLHQDCGLADDERLQIFAFAQCVGAAAVAMAMLSGKLSYEPNRPGDKAPRMPMLAGAVLSQTHMHCIGMPMTQARTWLPAMIRDFFKRGEIPFAVRAPQESIVESMADRLFSALPVPDDEQCPRRPSGVYDEDDCATCRRIRFIEAPLFKHHNISYDTHRDLPRLFGNANVRLFAHAAKCVEAERLVGEDANNSYVLDANIRRYMALPVAFLHGAKNELFHVESAIRTADHYRRIQPRWADLVRASLLANEISPTYGADWVVPDYGHVDVLIANDAKEQVFDVVCDLFDRWLTSNAPRTDHDTSAAARFPLTGPFIGGIRKVAEDELEIGISFQVDDRNSDAKGDQTAPAGEATWAFARAYEHGTRNPVGQAQGLEISPETTSPLNNVAPGQARLVTMIRIAHGKLVVPAQHYSTGIDIECYTIHERLGAGDQHSRFSDQARQVLNADSFAELPAFVDSLRQAALTPNRNRVDRPSRTSVSHSVVHPEIADIKLHCSLSAATLNAFSDSQTDCITFAATCCRYPAFNIDKPRVDAGLEQIAERTKDGKITFGVLLGDQIYADYSAGFADELNPMERYFERHRLAFARRRAGDGEVPRTTLGDWLATLPVVMTPDDHEFTDGYPDYGPLLKTSPASRARAQLHMADMARAAVRAFQTRQSELLRYNLVASRLDVGPVRVLILDTRSQRLKRDSPANYEHILTAEHINAIGDWLADPESASLLNVICTGSVVLPGLRPDPDPSQPGNPDTLQASPADRKRLLNMLEQKCLASEQFRFLLVSGDYHLSAIAYVEYQNRNVGACIVAPPLYAPMSFANSKPSDLDWDETLPNGMRLVAPNDEFDVKEGSGVALISVAIKSEDHRYEIRLNRYLHTFERYGGGRWEDTETLVL